MEGTQRRYDTPSGRPCPRSIRSDGTVEGEGACLGCGTCLEPVLASAWDLTPPADLLAGDGAARPWAVARVG